MTHSDNKASKKFAEGMWKLIMARGIVLMVAGLILLIFPKATLTTLIFIMGIYWLIDGVVTIYNAVQRRKVYNNWWWGLLTGILGVIAGIIVVVKPFSSTVFTTSFLIWFLGIVALINGISGLTTGLRLRKTQKSERSMIWGGLFSIALGIILISSPFTSALVIIKILGSFALFAGIITFFLAKQIKKNAENMKNGQTPMY